MTLIGLASAVTLFTGLTASQQIGTRTPENRPSFATYKCTRASGCIAQNTSIVLDPEWRVVSAVNIPTALCKEPGYSKLDKSLCPDSLTCARNCALEGVNYTQMGVRSDGGSSLTLNMYVNGLGVTPRVYLLDANGTNYENLKLANAEIAFDVDVSKLPCGMNGALYLSEMDMTGGRSDLNPAGASRGTGYCDAQCPTQYTWINGVVNFPLFPARRACDGDQPNR